MGASQCESPRASPATLSPQVVSQLFDLYTEVSQEADALSTKIQTFRDSCTAGLTGKIADIISEDTTGTVLSALEYVTKNNFVSKTSLGWDESTGSVTIDGSVTANNLALTCAKSPSCMPPLFTQTPCPYVTDEATHRDKCVVVQDTPMFTCRAAA